MNSTLISKVEKARRYAEEPDRVRFQSFRASFHGGHDEHTVTLDGDTFSCTCHSFETYETCAHVMALQRMLAEMLTEEQRTVGAPASFASA